MQEPDLGQVARPAATGGAGTKASRAIADPTLWAAIRNPAALSGSPRASAIAGDNVLTISSGALHATTPSSRAATHGWPRR